VIFFTARTGRPVRRSRAQNRETASAVLSRLRHVPAYLVPEFGKMKVEQVTVLRQVLE